MTNGQKDLLTVACIVAVQALPFALAMAIFLWVTVR
jgi:hypothetical protein